MQNGYWSFPKHLTYSEMKEMHDVLNDAARNNKQVLMVKDGIEFHPFGSLSTPDAICLYCCSANLTTSIDCQKCGAPLVH